MSCWAGLDPGRCKCGLVLVDLNGHTVCEGRIVPPEAVAPILSAWSAAVDLQGIVLGNGTTSRRWRDQLPSIAPLHLVDERGSTLQARQRYWELWPPRLWRRLIPLGLQSPPEALDAVAALVLVEKHLQQRFSWARTAC
ncbi:MAG: resolvase [Synechococcus sp.]